MTVKADADRLLVQENLERRGCFVSFDCSNTVLTG